MIKLNNFNYRNQILIRCLRFTKVLTLFLILSTNFCFAADTYSQSTKISVTLSNTTVKRVLDNISNQTEFVFIYQDEVVNLNRTISVEFKDQTIDKILNDLFAGTNNSYVISGKQVYITAKSESKEQPREKATLTGKVVDHQGMSLVGVGIYIKGRTGGATTDVFGKYNIKVNKGDVLTFNYIGYVLEEVKYEGQKEVDIVLKEDNKLLDEVVVVAYGTQRKESVVGAITSVDIEKLKIPGASVSNSLAGQLAGIVAMTRSGEPGKNGAAEFYIRGISSFRGAANPLVLVDGIERELDLVDVEDIESFSILKDAAASAVYGMRGANGVILVTTKKGRPGKTQFEVRGESGITSPTIMPKFANSYQWAEMYNEAVGSKYYTDTEIDRYRTGVDTDLYPNVNWINELYKDQAHNQKVNVSLRGGGSIATYYVSGSYYNESSIFKDAVDRYNYNSSINYNKFNFRANLDLKLTGSTNLNINMANIYEKSFAPGRTTSDIWGYTFNTSPNAFPVEYSDGTISSPSTDSGYNPWNILVHSGYREQFWNSAQSLIGITQDIGKLYRPLTGLTANIKFSWDAWNTSTQIRSKEPTQYHASGRDKDGNLIFGNPVRQGNSELSYSISTDGTMTNYLEGSLNYNRLFGNIHRVGGLLLYNQKIHTRTQTTDRYQSLPYKHQGIAGRVTYGLKDLYFAEVNVGYNGSENYAKGHRFGIFPAVAVGWMVSGEEWFAPISNTIDLLKIKASYGKVGNDNIGGGRRWMYEPTIVGSESWNYGNTGGEGGAGIRIGEIENLFFSWEEALKRNLGIELSFFNRLKIQADVFQENRTGIFLQRGGLPALAGLSTAPYTNIGETVNRGFDATIDYIQKIGEVTVTARGSFTFNRNQLLNNDEPDWEYKYQNRIGKPFGTGSSNYQPFGLIALGLFENQEEINSSPVQSFGTYRVGDVKYQDINGDGIINSYDQVAIGYTNIPEIVYGFGTTFQWKNFDLNVFFQGVSRTSFFLSGTSMRPFSSGNLERSAINADIYDNVWKTTNTPEQNADAIYPRLSTGGGIGSSNNTQNSTWNLRDGSYMRLKNFEFGYSIPKSVLKGTFLTSIRLYTSGTNLLTFSNFKLWDPEKLNGSGEGYPPSKIINFGLSASF